MCILMFSTTFVWNIFHYTCNWDIVINIKRLCIKYIVFLSAFIETRIFFTELRNILKYQISWKAVQWEPSCCMQTYRQIDTKLLVVFAILQTRLKFELLKVVRLLERDTVHLGRYVLMYERNVLIPTPITQWRWSQRSPSLELYGVTYQRKAIRICDGWILQF